MDNSNFYNSKLWKRQRKYIWLKQKCMCAICHRPVYVDGIGDYLEPSKRIKGIVHHIKWLDNENVNDDEVAIDEENLIGVCITCHNLIHKPRTSIRNNLMFDENGQLITRPNGDAIQELINKKGD